MCFVIIKGWSKYTKQKKTLEPKFCEKTSSAICAIFDTRCCSKLAFERWSDFRSEKKLFCYIWKNNPQVKIVVLIANRPQTLCL